MLQLILGENHTSRNALTVKDSAFKVKPITGTKYPTSYPLPNGSQQSQSRQDRGWPLIAVTGPETIC